MTRTNGSHKEIDCNSISLILTIIISGTCIAILGKCLFQVKSINLDNEPDTLKDPMYLVLLVGLGLSLCVLDYAIFFFVFFFTFNWESIYFISFSSLMRIVTSGFFEFLESIFVFTGLIFLSPSVYASLKILRLVNFSFVSEYLDIKVYQFMWHGIFWMIVGVTIIGITACIRCFFSNTNSFIATSVSILLVIIGGLIDTSGQVTSAQCLKKNTNLEPNAFLGIGGYFIILFSILAYPLVYYIPGDDFDCLINFNNTVHLIVNSLPLIIISIAFSLATYVFSIFSIFLICKVGPIWSSVTGGYTIIVIWIVQIALNILSDGKYGDVLSYASIFEFIGILLLVYGVAIYTAPTPLSILVTGNNCLSCGYDFSDEYDEVIRQVEKQAEEEERLLFNKQRLKSISTDDRDEDLFASFNFKLSTSDIDYKHEGSSRDLDFKHEASTRDFDFNYEASASEKKAQDNLVNESQELDKPLSQTEDLKESKIENQENSSSYSQQKDEQLLQNKDSKEMNIEIQDSNSLGQSQEHDRQFLQNQDIKEPNLEKNKTFIDLEKQN
jgi:hypothetical protein